MKRELVIWHKQTSLRVNVLVFSYSNELSAELIVKSRKKGVPTTIMLGKLPLDVVSVGALPPVVNGYYAPADVQVVDIPSKSAKTMVVVSAQWLKIFVLCLILCGFAHITCGLLFFKSCDALMDFRTNSINYSSYY